MKSAVALGALILVPAIISFVRTVQREQRVQELGGVEKVNGWIVLILYLVIGIAVPPYMQSSLNKLWERYPALADGGAGAIPAAEPAQQPAQPAQPAQPSQPAQPGQEQQPPPPPPPAQ